MTGACECDRPVWGSGADWRVAATLRVERSVEETIRRACDLVVGDAPEVISWAVLRIHAVEAVCCKGATAVQTGPSPDSLRA